MMSIVSGVRLGLDYGTTAVKAAIALPGRDPTVLRIDGATTLPCAVLVEPAGELVVGSAAWQRASEHPQRFVPAPARLAHLSTIDLDTDVVAVADLVAATLRRVVTEAAAHAGAPVGTAVLTTPAGWGPRRRDLLRRAAHQAGLTDVQLVAAPVAVGWHLLAQGHVDQNTILVCDLGAGTCATVLRRQPGGYDILSTVDDPDAGGMALDVALLDAVTTRARGAIGVDSTGEAQDGRDWYTDLDQARTAKEAVAAHANVVMSPPYPLPAVTLTHQLLADAAAPTLTRAADTARRAIAAAEVPADAPLQVYCVGATTLLPGAVDFLAEQLPATPVIVAAPVHAAALGAATRRTTAPVSEPMQMPDGRDIAVAVGTAAAAAAMTVLFLADSDLSSDGTVQFAPWGLLAAAAVHATIAVFAVALLLPWLVPGTLPTAATTVWRLPVLLPAAAATATATVLAGAAIIAAVWHIPFTPILTWTVLPVLPVATAAAAAGLATHRDPPPPWRWLRRLRPPVVPLALGAVALILIQAAGDATSLALPASITRPVGGLAYAAAVVGLLTTSTVARLLLTIPVVLAALVLAVADASGVLGVGYAAAITAWWIIRAVNPATSPTPAS